jgi:hypothetical protein
MGLSSSQARLLNLTSRMHQIEYNAARIEAMKLQMANESDKAYDEYLEALDARKVVVKTIHTDGTVTFVDITGYDTLTKAGYRLYYADGEECGEWPEWADNTDIEVKCSMDPINCTLTSQILTNLIDSGVFVLAKKAADDTEPLVVEELTSVANDTGLMEVQDEVDLKKAEAKYESDMRRIDMKDRKYDTDLAALETERNATKQEMETLQTVAKDNVDRTFKLFS